MGNMENSDDSMSNALSCPIDVKSVPSDDPDDALSGIGLLVYERVPPE
jgi:hypothetical protein